MSSGSVPDRPLMEPLADKLAALWETADTPPDVFSFLAAHPQTTVQERGAVLLVDQWYRWHRGTGLSVEDYLDKIPAVASDRDLKLELIINEYGCRQRQGESPDVQAFAARFPDLRETLVRDLTDDERQEPHEPPLLTTVAPSNHCNGTDDWNRPAVSEEAAGDRDETSLPDHVGRYRVNKLLGEGGFGRVYLAYDEELYRTVAIKVPHWRRLDSPEDIESYRVEARIVASLDHPHIVPVYDVGQTPDGRCYVVSKLIDGEALSRRIKRARPSALDASLLVGVIAEALHHAHQHGLVHRDVKPANILIDAAGQPYLTDFGLALRETELGSGEQFTGTAPYMSPEQARGEGHLVDGRSDIFSLGIVFYELLTGVRPFRAERALHVVEQIKTVEPRPPRQLDDSIPKELERICLKALSKRATDRYTTALDMAEDLRHWVSDQQRPPSETEAPRTGVSADPEFPSAVAPVRIVPKGLRSFDANDADFFLQLLPGPHNREGLPESIRFWKTAIEEKETEETFRVGLIYGPSGCGKSSLVKAGLLPVLDDNVLPLYSEATPDETETRLLRGLCKRVPGLSQDRNLIEVVAQLRRGRGLPANKQLLIVLDQFEQWLHARHDYAETQLLQALRQCDGERVQCLVMVRDDFWMAATRFMRDLEVPLVEGRTSAAVDRFDLPHARKVLAEFGRAYERLPDNLSELTVDQSQFLDEAINGLAEEGRVISVRLSLFAEMVKGKPWTPATLKDVGGAEGIGVTFLEDTFSSPHAPPERRLHQKALRAVLSALLPEGGSPLRGAIRSRVELLKASGYEDSERDFDEVLRILNDLRLITPTDPEGATFDDLDSQVQAVSGEKYYQLTHDYLVPSLHEWLNRKRRETRRGRAELLLEQRAREWTPSRHNRLLPTPLECLNIALFTPRANRTSLQRHILRRAALHHGRRLGFASVLVAALSLALVPLLPKPKSQDQLLLTFANPAASTAKRIDAFDGIHINDIRVFPLVIEKTREIEDVEVAQHALHKLADLAEEKDAPDSVRAEIIELAYQLINHWSPDVRAEAFNIYARMAPLVDVLEEIRNRSSTSTENWFILAAGDYLSQIDLPKLSETERAHALRQLVGILEGGRDERLIATVAAQLAMIEPDMLLNWLMEAYKNTDVKTAAERSLVPFLKAADQERIRQVGTFVEERLSKTVQQRPARIATTYELEYLVQALGFIQTMTREVRFHDGFETVIFLLTNRERLQSEDILETVIESYVRLAAGQEEARGLQELRKILADESASWPARVAAAKAVGDLDDEMSLPLLKVLASGRETFLNLRIEAVKSLGKLGRRLTAKRQVTEREIIEPLIGLIEQYEDEPQDVVLAAVESFGQLADADHAPVVFPLLLERSQAFSVSAIRAIQNILVSSPETADRLVQNYLGWRINVPDDEIRAFDDPDQAIIGFGFYQPVSSDTKSAAKAVAAALAKAQATHKKLAARIYAGKLTEQLVDLPELPHIDPNADGEIRDSQYEAWRRRWEETEPELSLTAGRLILSGEAR